MTTYADRVMETTTTTGTGAVTLGGAVSSYRSFASALTTGAEVTYAIVSGAAWEVGRGVFTAPATLTRATVLASSNSGALVSLGTGTKQVFLTVAADDVLARGDVSANDIAPGDTAAEIETALAAAVAEDRACIAAPGTYDLDAPVDIPRGAKLWCIGGVATFVPAWAPDASEADSRDNYVFGVRGSLSATTTTTSGIHPCGSPTLTLGSTTGIAAGDWLYITGNNGNGPPTDETLMSDGTEVQIREMVLVDSVTDATTVALVAPTRQHHASGKAVTKLASVGGDVEFVNIAVRAPGGSIACGISAEYARNIKVHSIEIEGLSRAGIDLFACQEYQVRELFSHGEVNSWIHVDGCLGGDHRSLYGSPTGERVHALGIPRGQVSMRNRCKWIDTDDAHFIHGCVGWRHWGGHYLTLTNSFIEDMDGAEVWARDPEIISAGSPAFGIGIDGGPGPLEIAEFGFGNTIDNVTIDCASMRSTGVFGGSQPQYAFFWHDHFRTDVSNFNITNRGKTFGAGPTFANGMNLRDCTGFLTNARIQGVYTAMGTHNVYGSVRAKNVSFEAVAGSGSNAQFGYIMNAQGGPGCEVSFDGVNFANWNGSEVVAGTDLTGNPSTAPDWSLMWRDVEFDGWRADYVTLARRIAGAAFAQGDICQFDDASSNVSGENARVIKTPVNNARDVAAVMCAEFSGYNLIAPAGQTYFMGMTDGAIGLGSLVAVTSARRLTATASAADAIGRTLRKTGGVSAVIVGGGR